MDKQIELLHERLMIIMKEIHQICVDNNLRYTLAGGSLIGAMRHKGFIPWDDDMDVMMPYDDYLKFIDIVFSKKHEWLDFYVLGKTNNYYSMILQAHDRRTTLIQEKNGIPLGVFIDIFPYIYSSNSLLGAKLNFYLFRLFHVPLLYKTNKYNRSALKTLCFKVISLLPVAFLKECIDRQMMHLNKKKKKYSFDPTGELSGIVPTEYFEGGFTLTDFENNKFYRIVRADEYLTSDYGDYMTLPPVEKQVASHMSYLNTTLPYKDYAMMKK